jgi:hypothetical protein
MKDGEEPVNSSRQNIGIHISPRNRDAIFWARKYRPDSDESKQLLQTARIIREWQSTL